MVICLYSINRYLTNRASSDVTLSMAKCTSFVCFVVSTTLLLNLVVSFNCASFFCKLKMLVPIVFRLSSADCTTGVVLSSICKNVFSSYVINKTDFNIFVYHAYCLCAS